MTIRWINQRLGTAAFDKMVTENQSIFILDVRDMVDKKGNSNDIVKAKIEQGVQAYQEGRSVVVCCDYGISRSNAIAAGILAKIENRSFHEAVRQVIEKTKELSIKTEMLHTVSLSLEGNPPTRHDGPILITGGSGLLGTAIQQRLERFIAPSSKEVDLLQGSSALSLLAQEHNPCLILHLANPRMHTLAKAMGESLVMLKNVIDVCITRQIHLVALSGWEVFSGYRTTQLAVTEHTPPMPGSTYGEAKLLAETLLNHCAAHSGLQFTSIRSSPIYGRGEKPKFIYHFIEKALKHADLYTHRYQNGFPALDLLHLDDAAEMILQIAQQKPTGVFHLGTGRLSTTKEVAELIVELTGSRSQIYHRDIQGYAANIAMTTTKTSFALREPKVDIRIGLQRILEQISASSQCQAVTQPQNLPNTARS